jgi:carbon storage regulator
MLVLSRQLEESIVIGDQIVVKVVDIRGDKVRLGIVAPDNVPVHRQEVQEAILRQRATGTERPTRISRAG